MTSPSVYTVRSNWGIALDTGVNLIVFWKWVIASLILSRYSNGIHIFTGSGSYLITHKETFCHHTHKQRSTVSLRIGAGVQGPGDLLHGKQASPLKTLAPSLPEAATADATFLSTIDRGCSSVRHSLHFINNDNQSRWCLLPPYLKTLPL